MKNKFSKTPLGRFRMIALAEGISFLLLLFLAMPLKYMANFPEPVKYTGWMHGVLFILYIFALLRVAYSNKWSFWKMTLAFIVSLIPFGTFVMDKKWREEEGSIAIGL